MFVERWQWFGCFVVSTDFDRSCMNLIFGCTAPLIRQLLTNTHLSLFPSAAPLNVRFRVNMIETFVQHVSTELTAVTAAYSPIRQSDRMFSKIKSNRRRAGRFLTFWAWRDERQPTDWTVHHPVHPARPEEANYDDELWFSPGNFNYRSEHLRHTGRKYLHIHSLSDTIGIDCNRQCEGEAAAHYRLPF